MSPFSSAELSLTAAPPPMDSSRFNSRCRTSTLTLCRFHQSLELAFPGREPPSDYRTKFAIRTLTFGDERPRGRIIVRFQGAAVLDCRRCQAVFERQKSVVYV